MTIWIFCSNFQKKILLETGWTEELRFKCLLPKMEKKQNNFFLCVKKYIDFLILAFWKTNVIFFYILDFWNFPDFLVYNRIFGAVSLGFFQIIFNNNFFFWIFMFFFVSFLYFLWFLSKFKVKVSSLLNLPLCNPALSITVTSIQNMFFFFTKLVQPGHFFKHHV